MAQRGTRLSFKEMSQHTMVATLLAVLVVVLLTATAPDIGLTWDEPAYIVAAESYVAWLGELVTHPGFALSTKGIRQYWEPNHEHPPVDKVWSGLVWSAVQFARPHAVGFRANFVCTRKGFSARGWASNLDWTDLTAHRLGNMLLAGALVGLLYLMVAMNYGQITGLIAASALITMPRFFFHAHLAALDVPAAFAIFAVVSFFWHTKDRPGLRWGIWLGLIWGLALATKANAVFVLPTLLLWTLIFQRRPYLFGRLVMMGLLGIPLSLAIWPWLYYEFPDWLAWYVRFLTIDHWEIGQWYLGRFYMPPPWHFPFVMTVAVTPLTLTILCGLGIVRAARERGTHALGWLFVFCALAPMLAFASGQSKVYDNDRFFMPCFPYLAALAGLGFRATQRLHTIQWLQKVPLSFPPPCRREEIAVATKAAVATQIGGPTRSPTRWTTGRRVPLARKTVQTSLHGKFVCTAIVCKLVCLGVMFAPHITLAWNLYPHLLSYYSETIGGLRGATRLGLETTYWCETYAKALPYLNTHAQPGDIVWVQDWSHDVMFYYQLHGKLRRDLRITWPTTRAAWGRKTVFRREDMRGVPASIWDANWIVLQYRQTGAPFVAQTSLPVRLTSRPTANQTGSATEIESTAVGPMNGPTQWAVKDWLHGREAVYRLSHQGIPLMEIYRIEPRPLSGKLCLPDH